MDEIYRMLGGEHEADLECEAQKRRRAAELPRRSRAQRLAAAIRNVGRQRKRMHVVFARIVARAGLASQAELEEER